MTQDSDAHCDIENQQVVSLPRSPTLSPKRQEVYNALLKSAIPLSAYELLDVLKRDFQRQLTPISIYRMLDFLEQQHLVRKLKSAGKYLAIRPDYKETEHQLLQFLICRECGHVRELGIDPQVLRELNLCIVNCGYELKNRELELECLCDQCLERAHVAH